MDAAAAAPICRVGGNAGVLIGLAYLAITGLYVVAGPVPDDGQGASYLAYLSGKEGTWWGITGVSVLTDLLFLPLAVALYVAMRPANEVLALLGGALLVLFAVLDLAVTWPSYAALIQLSGDFADLVDPAERAATIAAANYAAAVLDSSLFAFYVIGVPALGIGALGLVMARSGMSAAGGYLGILTALLGMAAVFGPIFVDALTALAIPTAVLTTVWTLIVGYRLIRLSREPTG
ncbi:MAG TPA: DUF4386 family protein [Candidatus Limnocylindria bacterium]